MIASDDVTYLERNESVTPEARQEIKQTILFAFIVASLGSVILLISYILY